MTDPKSLAQYLLGGGLTRVCDELARFMLSFRDPDGFRLPELDEREANVHPIAGGQDADWEARLLDQYRQLPEDKPLTTMPRDYDHGFASCGHGYAPGSPNCPQCHPTPENITYLVNQHEVLRGDLREAVEERDTLKADNERLSGELEKARVKRDIDVRAATDEADRAERKLAEAERTIAELKTDLSWERGWDVCRKAQMGAVVDAALAWNDCDRRIEIEGAELRLAAAVDEYRAAYPGSEKQTAKEWYHPSPVEAVATPPEFPEASAEAPREIRVGSTVRCDFGDGQRITGKVVRKDSSDIPYLVEYTATEAVVLQTWADPRSTTWLSDPPEQPRGVSREV